MVIETRMATSCSKLETPSLQKKNYNVWRILQKLSLIQKPFGSFGQKMNFTLVPALENNAEKQKKLHFSD